MLISEQNCHVIKPEETLQLFDLLKSHYRPDTSLFCGQPPAARDGAGAEEARLFQRGTNVFIDNSALDQVLEHVHSDMVIAVQTGISMASLAEILAAHDQIFPVDIEDKTTRLIDVISSGDGGYLEQGYGYMRSLVLGLELAYADGKCAKLGGRVVKNVTGLDLTKLVVGGRGVFGIPYLAHLRLFARPASCLNFVVSKRSAADLLLLAAKLLTSGLPLAGLELIESDSLSVSSSYQYALVIQLMGSDALITEVLKQIREYAESVVVTELSRADLILAHPQLVQPAPVYLEVSLSRASAAALIDHLRAVGQRGQLRYRPGMGRLYLDCADEETLERAFQTVSEFISGAKYKTGGNALAEFDQPIIAKTIGPYRFSSHCQRASDLGFGQLVQKLRTTFDPHRCFNPGVTFHGS